MAGFAPVHPFELGAPPRQQTQTLLGIADFVPQIIRPTAETIDVVEILMELFGQQRTHYMKVFIVMRGQPAGIFPGFGL
jgi:hypothetical protein